MLSARGSSSSSGSSFSTSPQEGLLSASWLLSSCSLSLGSCVFLLCLWCLALLWLRVVLKCVLKSGVSLKGEKGAMCLFSVHSHQCLQISDYRFSNVVVNVVRLLTLLIFFVYSPVESLIE